MKLQHKMHQNPEEMLCSFWATVCKTVRSMPMDNRPVCPVCDVGVLWPNGCMDKGETWHVGRPLPWPHCVFSPNSPMPACLQR